MTKSYCDHCGESAAAAGPHAHQRCRIARTMEPPRYCAECGRRMVVQVTPRGWSARCSGHGVVTSDST